MPIGDLWDPEVAAQVRSKLPQNPYRGKKVDVDSHLQDVVGAYHAIGGFQRLAALANEDPKWFFNRFGDRLLPNVKTESDVNFRILPALPPNALDGDFTDVTSQALTDERASADLIPRPSPSSDSVDQAGMDRPDEEHGRQRAHGDTFV